MQTASYDYRIMQQYIGNLAEGGVVFIPISYFTFGWDEGPAVERKYGSQIFALSEPAVAHFNDNFLWPWLRDWFDSL
jgi:hypothetical protein